MSTRAILIERHGPPEVFVEREVPLADPGPAEVHLRVEAAGINFADLMMRSGLYDTVPPKPYSPGFEVAGRVAQVGPDVEGIRDGDRVVALLRHGGYARDVIVPARNCFPCPEELSAIDGAAIPVVFLTAWVCLNVITRVRPGENCLVLGAGGGVGTAAVQLAVREGLTVWGTAGSAAKREFVVEELGAAGCFDSRGSWERDVRAATGDKGLDIALDSIGGPATSSCRRLLGPLGRLVFYGFSAVAPTETRNWLRVAWAWLRTPRIHPYSLIVPCQSVHGVHLLHLHEKEDVLIRGFEELLPLFVAGELRPVVDRTFPLTREGAAGAHAYIHARRNLGKVVLVAD